MACSERDANSGLRFYAGFDRIPLIARSFRGKVLLVAFLGTHVPLLALLLFYVVREISDPTEAIQVGLVALSATLLGTAVTMLALNALLKPIHAIGGMLEHYRLDRSVPAMPMASADELGELARGTAETLAELDAYFTEAKQRDATTGALNTEGFSAALQAMLAADTNPSVALLELPELPRWQIALDQEAIEYITTTTVERLRLELPDAAPVGFLGRGRFALALTGDAARLEERFDIVLRALTKPLWVRSHEIKSLPRMGTAGAERGKDAAAQMRAAEAALLAAGQHEGPIRVAATEAGESIRSRLELGLELEQGLRNGAFVSYYQWRVDASTGQPVGAEALARWQHPTRGQIPPGVFVPLAERGGQIVELGEQILHQAVAWAERWAGQREPRCVSVNVAAQQFASGGLPATVATALKQHGLPPALLELELTESTLLADLQGTARQLEQLRRLGVRVALDDFGSGYSSLSYLGQLSLDTLKIDKGFVDQLHEPRYRRVTAGIVELAAGLDLRTTAEGVETAAQAETLKTLGCTELQGFLYARPRPAEQLADWPVSKFG